MTRLGWRIVAALMAGAVALGAAGCGLDDGSPSDPGDGTNGYVEVFTVAMPDGARLPCVSWRSGYAGGMSCDWEGAR